MGTGAWLLLSMEVNFQRVVEFLMLSKARVLALEGHRCGGRYGNIVSLLYPREVVLSDSGKRAYEDVRALESLLCFCPSTDCICLLCLHFVMLSVQRFVFGLNERFGANYYRLNAFGYSALFLFMFVDCLYSATLLPFCSSTACVCLLCLPFVTLSVRRFRFGLNERFDTNYYYRLNAFGASALFLFVDCLYSATLLSFCSSTACICLLCLHFVSLSVRRFRFGLNERFDTNYYYRLNAFGYSALFLFVDCLYSATLLCFCPSTACMYLSLVLAFCLAECPTLSLRTEWWLQNELSIDRIRDICSLSVSRLYLACTFSR
jgi:membrane protein YqaA with SNARE-associated domain